MSVKSTVQLHFVQELIDQVQTMEVGSPISDDDNLSVHAMRLSAAAVGKDSNAPTL